MERSTETQRQSVAQRQLTAFPDVPDFRDWPYAPALLPLKRSLARPTGLHILDQRDEGACTGFGLAAAINLLAARAGRRLKVSPWMLYAMARRHDEWRGERYPGSSCRGALKGWYNMGVCSARRWPADAAAALTLDRAREARRTTLGAYYRLGPRLSDYHAALNETGVIYCSAAVHDGWDRVDTRGARIPYEPAEPARGGHAFAIVGYTHEGFWIQNSWGLGWGQRGTALWTYLDWQATVMDAWVFRLALPTPQLWQLPPSAGSEASRQHGGVTAAPSRAEIAGHFVHLDDGDYVRQGRYWSTPDDVAVTAKCLAQRDRYTHLLLYAHGGLNSARDSARRIAAGVRTFKANNIYPYHCMYDTGLLHEIGDLVEARGRAQLARTGGLTDWSDRLIEQVTRIPGRALWREMKRSAQSSFAPGRAGTHAIRQFLETFAAHDRRNLRVHLAAHSTGSLMLAALLEALETLAPGMRIRTCSLFAPAASIDLFKRQMYPWLAADAPQNGIDRLVVYTLSDALEHGDRVAGLYGKSLLHLVSRAYEEAPDTPLLGLERHARSLMAPRLELVVSQGPATAPARCMARTHGEFDNDVATMNDLLHTILERPPDVPFTPDTLEY